jgi:hypothetical protein
MSEATNEVLQLFEPKAIETLDEQTQRQVGVARELFLELGRLMKSMTLYGPKHQSSLNFRARFFETLSKGLMGGNRIKVELQAYAIVIADQIIYEDPKIEGNFIYRFYTDGIRTLSFKTGVTTGEVDEFLDLILTDWHNPTLFEDDAVTLLWEKEFEHISYSVAVRYDQESEEHEEHLFQLNDTLDRLYDLLHTSPVGVTLSRIESVITPERQARLEHLSQINQRELLEKLIALSHETQRGLSVKGGRDKLIMLLDQIAQLFAHRDDVSELERFLRQAFRIAIDIKSKLIEVWAVPRFIQRVLKPLLVSNDPQALSALSCLQLLEERMTPHVIREIGGLSEKYVPPLAKLLLPHITKYPIEVSRSIRTGEFLQGKRLLEMVYASGDTELCLKSFETAWAHDDQGVRYEAINGINDELRELPLITDALFEGLNDSYSKVRTISTYGLSKLRSAKNIARLQELIDRDYGGKGEVQLAVSDLRKRYVSASLAGVSSDHFVKKLTKNSGFSIGRMRDHRRSALVALSVHSSGAQHTELIERELHRKIGGGLQEEARWGLAYLRAGSRDQEQMVYELFFRGQLISPKGVAR